MSLTEAPIFFFSCLCRWQKRLFSLFRAYVVVRSVYFLHFVLMSLTEAIIFFILCLCRWQERLFSSFCVYVVDRSVGKTLFCLTEWCCSLKFLVLSPSNRKYCFQILFLKPTDRVEVGPWWCFYWYDDRIKSPFIRVWMGFFILIRTI